LNFAGEQHILVSKQGRRAALNIMDFACQRLQMLSANNVDLTTPQGSLTRACNNAIDGLSRFNASRVNLAGAQGRLGQLY
jgi:outer membrane protein